MAADDAQKAAANVVIYTRALCGYCSAARKLLDDKGVAYDEIDATMSAKKRREMFDRSGRSTFPQIFINDDPIGGYDDLAQLNHDGLLDDRLGSVE
jgi:glutaredoxin 3